MSGMIKILSLNNEVEACFLEAVLKEKNIPYLLKKFHDTAYDGIYEVQFGWGMIEAREENREEIKRYYDEIVKKENIRQDSKECVENYDPEVLEETKKHSRKTRLLLAALFIILLAIILVLYNYNYHEKHNQGKKLNYIMKHDAAGQTKIKTTTRKIK